MPSLGSINRIRFFQIILAWSLFTSAYLFLWTGSVDKDIHNNAAAVADDGQQQLHQQQRRNEQQQQNQQHNQKQQQKQEQQKQKQKKTDIVVTKTAVTHTIQHSRKAELLRKNNSIIEPDASATIIPVVPNAVVKPTVDQQHKLVVAAAAAAVSTTKQPKKSSPKPQSQAQEMITENGFWGPAHRFPKYGTEEYAKQCPWVLSSKDKNHHFNNCSFYAGPSAGSGEGIAQWIAQVTAGFMLAQQANCHYYVDYGPVVDLTQVLRPAGPHNWTAPTGMDPRTCYKDKQHCALVGATGAEIDDSLGRISADLGLEQHLVSVPYYRYFYSRLFQSNQNALNSSTVFPGYDAKYGMACALNALFGLSPSASQFDAGLFSKILPTIHDEKTLVIAIYIRTGWTDTMASAETMAKRGKEAKPLQQQLKNSAYDAVQYTKCTLQLEKERIQHSTVYTRVAWMIITDSPAVKTFFHDKYDGAKLENGRGDAVTREILSTSSRGKQTRPQMNPSTTDFAEAMIDWYLIGESDIVVSSPSYTFGATGSARTARPLYDAFKCQLRIPDFIKTLKD